MCKIIQKRKFKMKKISGAINRWSKVASLYSQSHKLLPISDYRKATSHFIAQSEREISRS